MVPQSINDRRMELVQRHKCHGHMDRLWTDLLLLDFWRDSERRRGLRHVVELRGKHDIDVSGHSDSGQ